MDTPNDGLEKVTLAAGFKYSLFGIIFGNYVKILGCRWIADNALP